MGSMCAKASTPSSNTSLIYAALNVSDLPLMRAAAPASSGADIDMLIRNPTVPWTVVGIPLPGWSSPGAKRSTDVPPTLDQQVGRSLPSDMPTQMMFGASLLHG